MFPWQVSSINGVISYRNPQFWRHSSDAIAGTLHIRAKASASEQSVVSRVSLCNNRVITVTTDMIKNHRKFY